MSYQDKWKLNPQQLNDLFGGAQSAAKHFILGNFRSQSFQGKSIKPWKGKEKPDGRAILTGKSNPHMRQSFHFSRGKDFVRITNSKPYSGYHNEGSTKMPERRMIGESSVLDSMIEKDFRNRIKKLFKK
jgi:hypothetical protein